MNHWIRHTCAFMAALLSVSASFAPAHAQSYTFTQIIDSGAGFDPFEFGCPAINNKGDVAFRAVRDSGEEVILVAKNNQLTVIAEENDTLDFLGRHPSINDKREVSFAVRLEPEGEAILVSKGNKLTTIAETVDGPFAFFGFDTSLNNQGEVAFKAELDNFDEGLFVGNDDSAITTHYLASTSPFQGDDSRPSLNDAGQVAFAETLDDTFERGIFLISSGSVITIAETSGAIDSAFNPSLNASGVVAFQAFLDDGGEGIFTGSGGELTTIADTTGVFSFFDSFGPSLNDNGVVAFGATLDTGEQGLFVGADPVADRVIGTGDALAGSTVMNIVFCHEGLNNHGELAFAAQLEDGRTVIFKATPHK
jgi:hypothetical protein